MDLVLKNARLPGRGDALADIAISSGKIAGDRAEYCNSRTGGRCERAVRLVRIH
jgi:hypothetical protein